MINNDEYANSYVEFAEEISLPYLLRYNSNDTIKKYCLEYGKISFTLEINRMNTIDYNSAYDCLELVKNIIRNIESKFVYRISEPIYEPYFEFFTHKDGIFIPSKELGDTINKNDVLGKCISLKDFSETEIKYEKNIKSRIICDNNKSYISPNESIYYIQPKNVNNI